MQIDRFIDHEALSQAAVAEIMEEIRLKPGLLLGVATGSTPARTYEMLAQAGAHEPHLFRSLRILKLDEWGGLEMDDPATCEAYIQQRLINPLHIAPYRYIGFQSNPPQPEQECRRMSERLREHGPIDLCILGLGKNGHLAFNEPGEWLHADPHIAQLTQSSMSHDMLQQARSRPTFGLTVGMRDILQSRRVLLLVSGASKMQPLRTLMGRRITPHCPASFLWLHPNTRLLTDLNPLEKSV